MKHHNASLLMNFTPLVVRRTAPLLAAVLLPVVAFALMLLARDFAPQREAIQAGLSERATGVAQRLMLANAALSVAAVRSIGGEPRKFAEEAEARYFSALGFIDGGAPSALVFGTLPPLPSLSGAARLRLDNNKPVIALAAGAAGTAHVLLLRNLADIAGGPRTVVAVLNPDFLWGAAENPGSATSRYVLDGDGTLLFASPSAVRVPLERLVAARSLAGSGAFDWQDASVRYQAGYRRIPLSDTFALPDWMLVVSLAAHNPLYDTSTAVAFAAALLLAMLAALWLDWRRPRRLNTPGAPDCEKPHHGDRPATGVIAARDSGGPAVTEKTAVLDAFAEIDQAILSRASIDRIIETVIRQARALLACDLIAVSSVVRDAPSKVRTMFQAGDDPLTVERDDLPETLATALAGQPDGRWVGDAVGYPFLEHLATQGATRFLLLPVYCDGRLAAVFSLGRTNHVLGDDALVLARQFANRLGVAHTATARAEEVHFLGHFESMTSLPNRRHFRQRLSQEISRANRDRRSLVLMYIDLDQFKRVNEGAGHDVGDRVLKEASNRLRRHLREEDLLAHFGGDEFVLLLPTMSSTADAGRLAEKLIALLSQPFAVEDGELCLGASIGIGIYPNDGRSADALLQNADTAMTRAKKYGRSRHVFFEERVNTQLAVQFTTESEMHRALAKNEFEMFYQPQLDLRSGKIVAAEALIRWRHPSRGLLLPATFISIAEDSALIEQIGDYTRRAACAQFRIWESTGIEIERISVNLSSRELMRKDFIPRLEATLAETGVRPFALEIEITENTLVENSEQVMSALRAMRERGIRIAIDDFGTGYSSLSYLKRMPFDMLKIDRSFVVDIGTANDAESRAVTSAVLGIAHSLGKDVCAEGVETEAQRAYINEAGCELLQGYLISHPLPAHEFEAFVRNWRNARGRAAVKPESIARAAA